MNFDRTDADAAEEAPEAPETPETPTASTLTPVQQSISLQVAALRANLALQDQDIQQLTTEIGRRIATRQETATAIETLASLLPVSDSTPEPSEPVDEAPAVEGEAATAVCG